MSLKDKILSAQLKSEKVFVPQWDCEIEIREMNGGQRAKYFQDMLQVDANGNIRQNPEFINDIELVMMTAYDPETGERLFKKDDRDFLLQSSGVVLDFIAQKSSTLSGLNPNSVEQSEKN